MDRHVSKTYLLPSEGPNAEKFNLLITWLKSHINPADFFETNAFEDSDLHDALRSGCLEIVLGLQVDISEHIEKAREPEHNIEIDEDEMFGNRDVEWDDLLDEEIDKIGRDQTIEYLRSARCEISWLKMEISRLRIHKHNAKMLLEAKQRESFTYHPLARERVRKCDGQ